MKGRLEIGQNKWLMLEQVAGGWFQIIEAHRCTEVQVGEMGLPMTRGWSFYRTLDTPTPTHTYPPAVRFVLIADETDGIFYDGEEE